MLAQRALSPPFTGTILPHGKNARLHPSRRWLFHACRVLAPCWLLDALAGTARQLAPGRGARATGFCERGDGHRPL